MFARTFIILLFYFIKLTFICTANNIQQWQNVTQRDLLTISNDDNNEHFQYVLKNVIKPRIVGTAGHEQVKQFIINEIASLGMTVKLDEFNANVPYFGNVTFTNIIGQLNKDADKFLTLTCHYDSKYFPNEYFEGAIDSAVPCTIMLNIVKTLLPLLEPFKTRNDISLMLIFFDGEEAFKEWTDHDSLYGSRHLAKLWNDKTFKLLKSGTQPNAIQIREIDRIEVMILIDLIGGKNQRFFNFFPNTQHLYAQFVKIERKLNRLNLLTGRNVMFVPRNTFSTIDDDHKPFLEKNVPILHLIPMPFPNVWHTIQDDYNHLDFPAINNFNRILRIFTLEYLLSH